MVGGCRNWSQPHHHLPMACLPCAHIKTPEQIAVEEDEERILAIRLRRRLLLAAMAHVDRSDAADSALEGLRWATAAGIFYDKVARAGGVPSPTLVLTEELIEAEIERLETELNRKHPNNARACNRAHEEDLNRSLGQALNDYERKIRHDIISELTGSDHLGQTDTTTNGHRPSEGDV